jgi:hypothetical protein
MLIAALTSRSCSAPQEHDHDLMPRDFGPSIDPQAEHLWVVGTKRPIFPKVRPERAALYPSILTNWDQAAS